MPSPISWGILLAVTAWISWFCLDLDSTEVDITHILAFTYGLVAEPLWSIIASGAGLAAAWLLRQVGGSSGRTRTRNSRPPAPPYTLHFSRSIFGVTLGFVIYRLAGGEQLTISQPVPGAIPFLAAAISYSLVVFGLVFLERRIYRLTNLNPRLTILLGMLIVFPMPVSMMGAIAYAILGTPALVIYGIFVGIAAPFIRQVIQSMKLDEALVDRLVELEGLERFAESLAVALTSQDLYAVILDQALHATKADAGQLALFSEPEHELVPVAVEPPMGRDELIVSTGTQPELIGHVAASTQPVRIDNSERPQARKFHLKSETQALLGVPILDPAGNLGALIVEKYTRDPFTDTDQSVLVRIASQAAGAIRNARLYQELEQRLTEQSLLYQASAQIAETL
ncbi:MAG: GAF domain-containing protein, partial [Anaerolineales bacterium]